MIFVFVQDTVNGYVAYDTEFQKSATINYFERDISTGA